MTHTQSLFPCRGRMVGGCLAFPIFAVLCLVFGCKPKIKPRPIFLNSSTICSLTWYCPLTEEISGIDIALFDNIPSLTGNFAEQCHQVGLDLGLDLPEPMFEASFSRLSKNYRAEFDLPQLDEMAVNPPERLDHTSNLLGYLSPVLTQTPNNRGFSLIGTYFINLKGEV